MVSRSRLVPTSYVHTPSTLSTPKIEIPLSHRHGYSVVSFFLSIIFSISFFLSKLLIWITLWLAILANTLTGLFGCVMITQYLEYAILSNVYEDKGKVDNLLRYQEYFYRIFWSLALIYYISTAFWVYYTERGNYKLIYGIIFFLLWHIIQVSIAVALTSWNEMIDWFAQRLRHLTNRPTR